MRTAKDIGQEVADEVRGFLTVAGIPELDFLKRGKLDHHLMNKLRNGGSVTTGTIEKVYRTILEIDPDWVFRHELRDAVLTRAHASRYIRDNTAADAIQQAAFALDYWPRRGA